MSFAQTVGLIGGLALFLGWVLSDLLEEQMIGAPRRERQRAVARARSVVASRSAP